MRTCRVLICGILLALPAAARAQHAGSPATDQTTPIALPAELDRVLRDYERAWSGGDEAALAALFTDDGFVTSRTGWVRSRAAIQRRYENSGGDLKLLAVAWATHDTVGYIVGTYGYGSGAQSGRFLLALRRTAGEPWLIAADLDQ